ncbi:hypothetical protein H4582DRAFT_2132894, partial [Lactarius indigo]
MDGVPTFISQQIASIAPQVSISSTPLPPYPAFKTSSTALQVNFAWLLGLVLSLLLVNAISGKSSPFVDSDLASPIFFGLIISVINVDTSIGVTTTIFICVYGSLSLYSTFASLRHPELLYQSPFPDTLALFYGCSCYPASVAALPPKKQVVMEEPDGRKDRDESGKRRDGTLVLAIPGSFNTNGAKMFGKGSRAARQSLRRVLHLLVFKSPLPLSPHSREGTTIDKISRSLGYLFETCNHHSYFENEEARHRRMRACVEAAAELICRIDYRLDWFGEVAKVLSEIGHIEKSIHRQSHLIHLRHTLDVPLTHGCSADTRQKSAADNWNTDNQTRRDVKALRGSTNLSGQHGSALRTYVKRSSPGPRMAPKTKSRDLRNHEQQISELERIQVEADHMKNVDRELLFIKTIDNATYGLIRQLPGVSFDEPHRSSPSLINDIFNTPVTGSAPLLPIYIPGQQLKALAGLGRKLREVLDGQVAEGIFYSGTFNTIKSYWEKSKESLATHCILLNIICDLIIGSWDLLDYSYPESITTALVNMTSRGTSFLTSVQLWTRNTCNDHYTLRLPSPFLARSTVLIKSHPRQPKLSPGRTSEPTPFAPHVIRSQVRRSVTTPSRSTPGTVVYTIPSLASAAQLPLPLDDVLDDAATTCGPSHGTVFLCTVRLTGVGGLAARKLVSAPDAIKTGQPPAPQQTTARERPGIVPAMFAAGCWQGRRRACCIGNEGVMMERGGPTNLKGRDVGAKFEVAMKRKAGGGRIIENGTVVLVMVDLGGEHCSDETNRSLRREKRPGGSGDNEAGTFHYSCQMVGESAQGYGTRYCHEAALELELPYSAHPITIISTHSGGYRNAQTHKAQ